MKLYYSPGACSLSPHIVLREAGFPVELKKVDLASKKIEGGGDYLQINPKGYVPALELPNGEILTEGPAIIQYIADQKPESGLAPKAGTLERYRLLEMLNFITAEIHKSFSPLFNKAAAADWKVAATANMSRRYELLNKRMEGNEYVFGKQFTVADAYLFTTLNWTTFVGIDRNQWPALNQYYGRVAARPKVQEALKAEGLIK
jgi:glutathione S-transferase